MPLTPEEEKRLREKIRKELEERERRIRQSQEEEEKERQRRMEERLRIQIREEEEERFYTERGYVKYINHRGGVEWLTPEEVEQRKQRRKSRKPSSRRAARKKRKVLQWVINGSIVFIALFTFLFFYKFYPAKGKAVGTVVVQSDVPGARIFIDGIETPRFTPDTIPNIKAGIHYISIYKEGFAIWPPVVRIAVGKNKTQSVQFQLKNAAQMGTVMIRTNVSGYSVFVDGIPQAYTGNTLELPVGYHTIMIIKKGYLATPNYRRILVTTSQPKVVDFTLEAADEIASIRVFSSQRDAAVYINGKYTGYIANGTRIYLPPGVYDVTLRKNGYTPFPETETLSLVDGDDELLNFQLRPEPQTHTVRVITRNPGATIFVDGHQLPFVTPLLELPLSQGNHFINFMRGDTEYHPGDFFVSSEKLLKGQIFAEF